MMELTVDDIAETIKDAVPYFEGKPPEVTIEYSEFTFIVNCVWDTSEGYYYHKFLVNAGLDADQLEYVLEHRNRLIRKKARADGVPGGMYGDL